jgi:LPXTG-motif cell wall-anchored protein
MARPGTDGRRITREDLQAAYSSVVGEGETTAKAAIPQGVAAIGAAGLVLVTLAFLFGRRRGRSRSAVVEIRRL